MTLHWISTHQMVSVNYPKFNNSKGTIQASAVLMNSEVLLTQLSLVPISLIYWMEGSGYKIGNLAVKC